MTKLFDIPILPYTHVVGQDQIKLALELAYIAPRIQGVLISGQRGTGKSTIARAFAQMMYNHLPVTLPINATEDRVVGGWKIDELMRQNAQKQAGLLEEADGKLLYIDEVNLLDDHIVNIILDVGSTGVLVIQREGRGDEDDKKQIHFILVGTMNPEEGGLRPQLLDRFGLMVSVTAETDEERRSKILHTVLDYDKAVFLLKQGQPAPFLADGLKADQQYKKLLEDAQKHFYEVEMPEQTVRSCVALAKAFEAEGHRGDYILALGARAYAARLGERQVTKQHIGVVAPLALQHRQSEALHGSRTLWSEKDNLKATEVLENV